MLRRRRYFLLHWSLTKLISKTRNKLCSYYIVNGCNLLVNRDNESHPNVPSLFLSLSKTIHHKRKVKDLGIYHLLVETFRQRKEGSHDGVTCLIKTTLYTLVIKFGVKYILLLQRTTVYPLEFFGIKLSFSCCLEEESDLIKL